MFNLQAFCVSASEGREIERSMPRRVTICPRAAGRCGAPLLARVPRRTAVLPVLLSGFLSPAALPDALLALWTNLLADGVAEPRPQSGNRSRLWDSAVSAVATWFLRVASDRVQRRFRDRVAVALNFTWRASRLRWPPSRTMNARNTLDRLAMLRDQAFVLDHLYMSLFTTCGWILRLGVTVARYSFRFTRRWRCLSLFALPTVFTSTWRPAVERAVLERAAPANRLSRHPFDTATTAPPGKEVRVTRIGERLAGERRSAWERRYGPVAATRWSSAAWHTLAWAIFGAGYAGASSSFPPDSALRRARSCWCWRPARGCRPTSARPLESSVSCVDSGSTAPVGMAWLEDYAASIVEQADMPAPERLTDGIRFEHVSFAYPGTEKRVLDDVNLELPAGTVVAIVGENGAGKSTLVKLLCRMTRPTQDESWWMASIWRAFARRTGGGGWPGRFRISSGSSSRRDTAWAWATCRVWMTCPRWSRVGARGRGGCR